MKQQNRDQREKAARRAQRADGASARVVAEPRTMNYAARAAFGLSAIQTIHLQTTPTNKDEKNHG